MKNTARQVSAMSPAVILALIVKDLRNPRTLRAALASAMAAAPFLPAGLPVLLALAAVLLLVRSPATEPSPSRDKEPAVVR